MVNQQSLQEFINYTKQLKGDEKGEAQLFCDRLFRAFGHGGIIEANGQLEARIKFDETKRTKFADCLWSPNDRDGVLIEMKKRGEKNLETHFPQVRDYWIEMNPEKVIGQGAQKPKYIILCNFDTFIIYKQLSKVDEISINDFIDRASAFNFLLPEERAPIFQNNVEAISQDAARAIGEVFKYLVFEKREDHQVAQRFLLQSVLALFSEDFGLLPQSMMSEVIRDCQAGESSYDLFGGLFKQMANPKSAAGGRFKEVRYFNGGLFDVVEPIELDKTSINLLAEASKFNWKDVNPAIFGALFEGTLSAKERHQFGAHFTSEVDILKIVTPSIIRPWKERLEKTKTLDALSVILDDLAKFKVLDPACGCGNFLFVAYRELKNFEMQVIEKMVSNFTERATKTVKFGYSRITTKQFYGLDVLPIAVEVAKMTMMLARELTADDWNKRISPMKPLGLDEGLPLDSLEENIICDDALFCRWPEFDVVVGNPPYQSKNKMQKEMDRDYIERVRAKYPEVPGLADYCVYWFRRTHDELEDGQRAGLVGTNTVRQNYSREGGLDYIVNNNGTITDAVSTQVWSGDAVVHVSIVNWVKGEEQGKKRLAFQRGDDVNSPFEYYEPETINSALSLAIDLTSAQDLQVNVESQACFQGQTHGHEGFLLPKENAEKILKSDEKYKDVLFPFLISNDLLGSSDSLPSRYVIDFRNHGVFSAKKYPTTFEIIEAGVLLDRQKMAKVEKERNDVALAKNPKAKVNHHHANFLKNWWKLSYVRNELMDIITALPRYIVCGRVTKRPIFEFVSSKIHPNDALQVFPLADDYSFGIFQSVIHWEWFTARCSTLKADPRYTSNTVFDSFPWPQKPTKAQVDTIAKYSEELRIARRKTMQENEMTLRDLYRVMESSPNNPISDIQEKLDDAVRLAYGMKKDDDILSFLLNLNLELAEKESKGEEIIGPGLPAFITDKEKYITKDCVSMK